MHYVYFLKSIQNPSKTYTGYTDDLEARIDMHNSVRSFYTSRDKPWKMVAYIAFDSEEKAVKFEKYVKAGSGYALAKKRFF